MEIKGIKEREVTKERLGNLDLRDQGYSLIFGNIICTKLSYKT